MLDVRPGRTDLTSREIAKIIGGLLGGLARMAEIEDIKIAVRWWADTPEAWSYLSASKLLAIAEEEKEDKKES